MNFVFTIVSFILNFLVATGDAVIFVAKLIYKTCKSIYTFLVSALQIFGEIKTTRLPHLPNLKKSGKNIRKRIKLEYLKFRKSTKRKARETEIVSFKKTKKTSPKFKFGLAWQDAKNTLGWSMKEHQALASKFLHRSTKLFKENSSAALGNAQSLSLGLRKTARRTVSVFSNALTGLFVFFVVKPVKAVYSLTKAVFAGIGKIPRILSLKSSKKRGRPRKKVTAPLLVRLKYLSYGTLLSAVFVFLPLLFFIFIQELPNPKILGLNESAQATKIFDRHGALLYQIYATQNRTYVPLSEIPEDLRNATIVIEDKNFYLNSGFDLPAIVRAAIADLRGEPLQGASTITQQLIKSTLLSPEVSVERKVKEVILSVWANRIYSKDKILEMYFNQVPYGGTAWGAEAAAQTYFGKKVSELNLAESAFLAGLPRAPSIYSPYGPHENLWKKRQLEVLSRMEDGGYIRHDEAERARKTNLTILPPQTPINAPHFVMYVKEQLVKKYGLAAVEKGGLRVVTTLDLSMQRQAQKEVADEVEKSAGLGISNGATLITDPRNGDILAMVGSKNYADPNSGNVNLTTSERQPGSSIKVVTYTAALGKGYTAASIIDDSPVAYPSGAGLYTPVNYDGRFHGRVSLRLALANSYNIPAVKTLANVGVPEMVETAKKMGITTWKEPENYGLAITLGAAEVKMIDMANVYGTLANGGQKVDINPILKITNTQGNVLEEKKEIEGKQVIDPAIAFIMSDILSDPRAREQAFGTNTPLNIPGKTVSVKTGTTDNKRDNWTIGYTPSRLVAVWVGNNDNTPMSPHLTSGITGAAPIWNKIMTGLTADNSEKQGIPENIVQKTCFGRLEYFVKGTEASVGCGPQQRSSATSARR